MLELAGLPADCAKRRATGGCDVCQARPFSVCASVPDADLARLDGLAETVALEPDQALFRQDDPVTHIFNVTSGSLRLSRLLPDGRRQIAGFLFAGDFIGLSDEARHAFAAEALEPSTLCRFRQGDYRALMREVRDLETALLQRAGRELSAARDQALRLGRKSALERLASFLIDLPGIDPLRPATPDVIRLPMTRGEIADYLGLTIETVSRSLTKLKQLGLVRQLSLNLLKVERHDALRDLAEGLG